MRASDLVGTKRFDVRRLDDLWRAIVAPLDCRPTPRAIWDEVCGRRLPHPAWRIVEALQAAVAQAETEGDPAKVAEVRAAAAEYLDGIRVQVLGAHELAPVAGLPTMHVELVKEAGEAQLAYAEASAGGYAAPALERAAKELADGESAMRRARASVIHALAMAGGRTPAAQAAGAR